MLHPRVYRAGLQRERAERFTEPGVSYICNDSHHLSASAGLEQSSHLVHVRVPALREQALDPNLPVTHVHDRHVPHGTAETPRGRRPRSGKPSRRKKGKKSIEEALSSQSSPSESSFRILPPSCGGLREIDMRTVPTTGFRSISPPRSGRDCRAPPIPELLLGRQAAAPFLLRWEPFPLPLARRRPARDRRSIDPSPP